MEACKSKRKSRTDRIINISWCYFILLGHQWNLCDRGNSWNAIFLADLSEIKEGSWVDPEKNVLTAMNDLKSGFVGESMVLTVECQGTDFITRVWSPDMVFLLTLFPIWPLIQIRLIKKSLIYRWNAIVSGSFKF